MRSALLRGREHLAEGAVATVAEGAAAIALSLAGLAIRLVLSIRSVEAVGDGGIDVAVVHSVSLNRVPDRIDLYNINIIVIILTDTRRITRSYKYKSTITGLFYIKTFFL